ncbi:hypothetical protein C3489_37795 [Streptomyces sp. Ru71]|uniref:hypothetical protein n=1 Tax=Streptomyces sp. Ru71 TaxID=2080746 RepID=UPI000CDE5369|nr:hypothetical protein [Streptomyces sp. Ru71]POX43609.1 hypothetical protein C3489_37795 [Streptomyces sp. Ru71]
MTNSEVTFHGMRPWGVESEIIYCEQTALGDLDVHNAADFLGVTVSSEEDSITFLFERTEDHRRFVIRFNEVRSVEVEEAEDYDPDDEKLFYAFDSLGSGLFEFEAAKISGKLEAAEVSFEEVKN